MSHFHFSKGPDLEITFTIEKEKIQSISLRPSATYGLSGTIISSGSTSFQSEIGEWLESYVEKNPKTLVVPFNWEQVTPFTFHVLQVLQKIPFGSTLSYAEVATSIDQANAARAVGGACGRNPFLLLVPCHRVLARHGRIGGFTGGGEIKKRLLDFENIIYH